MIEDYHPTGREREVLDVMKTEGTATKQQVKTGVGCSEYILHETLNNLCMAGCLVEISTEEYRFEYDPMDDILPATGNE